MKKQEQSTQKSENIFSSNFKQEAKKTITIDFSRMLRFSFPKALLVLSALLLLPVLVVSCKSTPGLPGSSTTSGSLLKEKIELQVKDRTQLESDIKDISYRVNTLDSAEYLPSSPKLLALYEEKKTLPKWTRALTGVDQVIREVVSANSILQQITIGNILLDKDSQQIVLESVRIMQDTTGKTQENPVALAGQLVDALEASRYFKEVESSDLSLRQQVGTTGSGTVFTPVNVEMKYQFEAEKNGKDKEYDLKKELELLLQ